MEHIFMESDVLLSMIETQLTPKYISENYKQIFPDSELLEQLLPDFENLYKNNISEIINIEPLLSVLHKYGIKKYYNIILEPIIWKILNLEYQPTNLCEDILHDIINYSNDFIHILQYLIYNITTVLSAIDFTFSLPLYKSSHNNQDKINLDYAIKYRQYNLFTLIINFLENKTKGSLYSYLEKRGLIHEYNTELMFRINKTALLSISLTLSPKGYRLRKHLHNIIYSYIDR